MNLSAQTNRYTPADQKSSVFPKPDIPLVFQKTRPLGGILSNSGEIHATFTASE
jgi:hypothetical protein